MIRRVGLLALAGLVLVVGGWFLLFARPESSHLHALQKQQSQAESNVAMLEARLGALKALQLKTPAERAALGKLEQAVPEGPSLDQLLDSLNHAAVKAGVTLGSISTPTPAGWAATASGTPSAPSGAGPQSIDLDVSVNGTNAQVLSFVTALDSEPRLFVVDNFSLSGTSQATGKKVLMGTTAISVQAFYISAASADPASLFSAPGAQG
jgi:Tfp pilus assembly protein PilO